MTQSFEQKIEKMEALPLFPTNVWRIKLKKTVYESINQTLMEKLDEATAGLPALKAGDKWQTNQDLHELESFAELVNIIEDSTRSVLEFLNVEYDEFQITGCWANISAPGATHRQHTHPNNYLSGVYYVQADEGAQQIAFDDPRPQRNVIAPKVTVSDIDNAGDMSLAVESGTLMFFPAWLPHSVPANNSNNNRISIAFNIMFKEFSEEMSKPRWQGNITVK